MSLPYYKRYTRDLLDGTIGMGFELKLTYAFLIDLIMHHGGRLKDNPRYIAGQLECSVRKWNKMRSQLIELEKIYAENDFILNFRATFEAESLSKYRDKQAENSKKSNKNKGNSKNSIKPKLNHTDTDTDTDIITNVIITREEEKPKPKKKRKSSWREGWRPKPLSQKLKDKLNLTQEEYEDEFEKFHTSAIAKNYQYVCWDAAWRNWLQSDYGLWARKRKNASGGGAVNSIGDRRRAAGSRVLERLANERLAKGV